MINEYLVNKCRENDGSKRPSMKQLKDFEDWWIIIKYVYILVIMIDILYFMIIQMSEIEYPIIFKFRYLYLLPFKYFS